MNLSALKIDELVKSHVSDGFKKIQDQGARIPWNEAYLSYTALTRDEAER